MSSTPQVPPQSFGDSWSERMRMIRLRRKKEAFRFSEEFRIVPRWLKILCAILYVIAIIIGVTVMIHVPDARPADIREDVGLSVLAIIGIISAVSIFFAASIFMLGYVNR